VLPRLGKHLDRLSVTAADYAATKKVIVATAGDSITSPFTVVSVRLTHQLSRVSSLLREARLIGTWATIFLSSLTGLLAQLKMCGTVTRRTFKNQEDGYEKNIMRVSG
jgi:hypothetical protein